MYSHSNNNISVLTIDGKLVATNEDGKPIVGVAGKQVENEALSAVLANSFAEFESRDGKREEDTESKSTDSVSTDRLVLSVDSGWFFVSRVCTDFLVGCHVLKSSGIPIQEATQQVSSYFLLSPSLFFQKNFKILNLLIPQQHARISMTLRSALSKLDT